MDLLGLIVLIAVCAGLFWFIRVVFHPTPLGERIIGGIMLVAIIIGLLSFLGLLNLGFLHYKPNL